MTIQLNTNHPDRRRRRLEGRAFHHHAEKITIMEIPITTDPNVLERIYRQFAYLKDYPLNLLGAFIDEAVSLGALQSDDLLAFLMAYEVEEERPSRGQFAFLTPEENLSVRYYRHIRPVQPWPQPIIGVAFQGQQGVVTGTYRVDVVMRNIGNIQLWWGDEIGVIWEAFFDANVRARSDHELLMHQLWDELERYLAGRGVKRVLTNKRDPALDEGWYQAFLARRGYGSDPQRAELPGGKVAVMKNLEP
jgi:hypothetical protein